MKSDRTFGEWDGAPHGSTAQLGTASSTGTWLNGSRLPPSRFVVLRIQDPNGRVVCDSEIAHDAFACLLTTNVPVYVTLSAYRDVDGKIITESVPRPLTGAERLKDRLAEYDTETIGRIEAAMAAINELPGNVKKRQEILMDLRVARDNFSANRQFAVKLAEEEVEDLVHRAQTELAIGADALGVSPEEFREKMLPPPAQEGEEYEVVVHEAKPIEKDKPTERFMYRIRAASPDEAARRARESCGGRWRLEV